MHGGDVDVKDKAQLNTQQLHIDKRRVWQPRIKYSGSSSGLEFIWALPLKLITFAEMTVNLNAFEGLQMALQALIF